MPPHKIMIIRHAEKPDEACEPPVSVMAPGETGADNLTPRGWQRAGALVRFFAPRGGDHADRPAALFAAQADADFTSLRTQQTIAPLSQFLGQDAVYPAPPDQVQAAATAILAAPGPALVAWEHKNIAKLITAITGDDTLAPHWSGKRFDMVLVLDHQDHGWTLTQVPQKLLAGDLDDLLKPRKPGQDH